MQPIYLLFAGANGSGKSTYYNSQNWRQYISITEFKRINPDEVIKKNKLNNKRISDQLKAAKICIKELDECFNKKLNIIQETTLCGKTILKRIIKAKLIGYKVIVIYLGVDSPNICKTRISYRASIGGHYIDNETVEKRYAMSLQNVKEITYKVDRTIFIDNSIEYVPLAAISNQVIEFKNTNADGHAWIKEIFNTSSVFDQN